MRAHAEDKMNGINVPRSWDREHAYNIGLNWAFDKWNINLTSMQRSGWSTTEIDYLQVSTPEGSNIMHLLVGQRNQLRLNGFSRFDIRVHKEIAKPYGSFQYYYELYNIFNQDNPCCHNVGDAENIAVSRSGERVPTYDSWMPRAFSFGVIWSF